MRVLLISSNSSAAGGGEQYFVYLARGLAESGEDVTVLLSDRSYMDAWETKFKAIGAGVKRAPLKGLGDRPLRIFQSLTDRRQISLIRSLCEEIKPDVIHVNQQYDADGLDYLMGALGYGKAPVVGTIHMPMSLTKHPRKAGDPRTRLIEALSLDRVKTAVLKKWYRRYRYAKIFVAEAMRNEFTAVYGKDGSLSVIANGIDADGTPASFYKKETPLVGFCGRMDPQKDLSLLVSGWLAARKKGSNCNLLLIGDGILRGSIEKKLTREAPRDSWKITGWVDKPQDYVKEIDLFVLTSRFEGFPLAVLEAGCAGKRCLSVDFSGSSELTEKIPFLEIVRSRDPCVLGDAIIKNLNMNRPGREDIEKVRCRFSYKRMTEETVTVYRGLCPPAKVALMWPNFGFYHIARFRALCERLGKDRVLGIEFIGGTGDDETGQWRHGERRDLPIATLFPHSNMKNISRRALGQAIVRKLEEWGADIVFVNGYSTAELRTVIDWAGKSGRKCFTFSETKRDDFRRFFLSEWFKKGIIGKLSGAVCGGKIHRDYLVELGMPEENIFLGYDVVDNNFFEAKSALARRNDKPNRERYNLPGKYFITCSRFVRKKNLTGLLDAYKACREKTGSRGSAPPWGLVLCGAGSEEIMLRKKIEREHIEGVILTGPKPPEELALYYGLAACFVLASTVEQWGLVVNEAMASGLPVLVTRVAGAARELVEKGVNGYTFNPRNKKDLVELMLKMTRLRDDRLAEMGRNAQEKVASYSPERFAESIIKAIEKW